MTDAAPPVRAEVDRRFESLCVAGPWGAHATPQAGAEQLGRYWTTTSRASVKRRAIARLPVAAVAHADDGADGSFTLLAGRARVLDPLDPTTALSDPFAASVVGLVVGRIALGHLDEVIGYGELGRRVPPNWSLLGRVILSVEPDERLVADQHTIVGATGSWSRERPLPEARRRERTPPVRLDAAPEQVRRLVDDAWSSEGSAPSCSVGFMTAIGPVAVPAVWDGDHGSAVVRRDVLSRIAPDVDAGSCITLDRNAMRRADQKVGLILRGRPMLRRLPASHALADGHVGVALSLQRTSWWSGFESGTTTADNRAAA